MNAGRSTTGSIRRTASRRPKRGIAVVLVLGLLAITLAVAYATLRGQGTTMDLARNNSRALDAREAARSGLAAALRKISENGWSGVGVPLSANITANTWYNVTFTTGDAQLAAGDSKYAEYPFRVTIDSLGYASDPIDPTVQASHHSRCVVQLIRRALVSEPANWSSLTNYTVFQWANQNVNVQEPVQISGPAKIWGKMQLSTEYPGYTTARDRYLSDLNARRIAGKGDYRPLPSPLTITLSRQDATNLTLMQSKLGLTLIDSTPSAGNPLNHPGAVLSYSLYPGGQSYTIPVLQSVYGSTLQNVSLGADAVNNPLGVFRSTGPLSLQNNVQITGTIITDGATPEIQVYGTNVVLQPANLPKLNGSTQTYQLPVALVLTDLRINSAAQAQIKGFTTVWGEFRLKQGAANTTFAFQGNLVTNTLRLEGRSEWILDSLQWTTQYTGFTTNLLLSLLDPNRVPYFPDYMEKVKGFMVQPALTLQPGLSGVTPHWQDWTQPIYQKGATDTGLKWDMVRWEDGV